MKHVELSKVLYELKEEGLSMRAKACCAELQDRSASFLRPKIKSPPRPLSLLYGRTGLRRVNQLLSSMGTRPHSRRIMAMGALGKVVQIFTLNGRGSLQADYSTSAKVFALKREKRVFLI